MSRSLALIVSLALFHGCVLVNDFDAFTVVDGGLADAADAGSTTADSDVTGDGATDGSSIDSTVNGSDATDGSTDCSSTDTIYVTSSGDDANPGTIALPLRSIATAVALVGATATATTVHVGAGTFETVYETTSEINLVDGVTLRGGYSDDFCTYDPATYATIIVQGFLGGVAIDPAVTPIVSILGENLPSGVTLEGFRLSIGKERDDNHVGIRLQNTPVTIRDVTIADGDGREMTGVQIEGAATATLERVTLVLDNASHASTGILLQNVVNATLSEVVVERTTSDGMLGSHGIRADYSTDAALFDLAIDRSRIHGGRGASNSFGILIDDTRPNVNPITVDVTNCLIHGGESGSTTWGIAVRGRSRNVGIFNNTIYTGENGSFGYGIVYDYNASGPDVQNNVIFSGTTMHFCIWHQDASWTGTDTNMTNNLFFNCPFAAFYDGGALVTDAATINALNNSSANQVAATVPLTDLTGPDLLTGTMVNNDWNLAAGTPCTYADGAFPLATLTTDFNGNPRDATPSIGALEFSGTCTP